MQTSQQAEVFKLIEDHYREHYRSLIIRFSKILGAKFRAEDVVQEGYTKALEYWKSYDKTKPLNEWLITIMNNAMRDEKTAERMHGAVSRKEELVTVTKPVAIPTIIYERVVALINSKEEPARTVLRLALVEQHRPREVSDITSLTTNHVAQLVFLFRKEIRDKYRWSI